MSLNLRRDTLGGRHHVVTRRVHDEERKPVLPGFWVYVGDFVAPEDAGNDPQDLAAQPPVDTSPSSPEYENGATYAGPPYDYPAFRHGVDGSLEWKGHVDVDAFSSGDVWVTLPTEWRPDRDVSWITDVWDGSVFTLARMQVDASTGEVTLVFPAS